MKRFWWALAILVLMTSACVGTSDVSSSTTTEQSATTISGPPTTVTTTTTLPETTTSQPPAEAGLSFLVANDDGVFLVAGDTTTQLVEGDVDVVMDDLQSGIIFQEYGEIVYRLPSGESEPHELLVATSEQYLVLNDVVARGDDVEIWYTRSEGFTPDDAVQTLRVYSFLERSVTEIAEVGGWESGTSVSVSPDLIVADTQGEGWFDFSFHNSEFNHVEVAANPYKEGGLEWGDPSCCPSSPVLSDDGSEIAWMEGEEVEPGLYERIVVLSEVTTGRNLVRIPLPVGPPTLHLLDLGDDVVLVSRLSGEAGWLPALLIELGPQPIFTELPIAGNARLVRSRR